MMGNATPTAIPGSMTVTPRHSKPVSKHFNLSLSIYIYISLSFSFSPSLSLPPSLPPSLALSLSLSLSSSLSFSYSSYPHLITPLSFQSSPVSSKDKSKKSFWGPSTKFKKDKDGPVSTFRMCCAVISHHIYLFNHAFFSFHLISFHFLASFLSFSFSFTFTLPTPFSLYPPVILFSPSTSSSLFSLFQCCPIPSHYIFISSTISLVYSNLFYSSLFYSNLSYSSLF